MEITARKPLLSALTAFTRAYSAMLPTDQIRGVLTRGGSSQPISKQNGNDQRVKSEVGRLIQRVFYVGDNDVYMQGNIGLTPYANALNLQIMQATWGVLKAHNKFLRDTLPDDTYRELRRQSTRTAPVGVVAEQDDTERRRFYERWAHLRIFSPNPLAQYEPAHTWVDPNGYQLSGRIWRNGFSTRQRLDALLTEGINNGWSAERLSRRVEQFLRPDRADIRTNRPYGRDGSFDAMRLARTEITRAHGQAVMIASRLNPFVTKIDWRLSSSHKHVDICDELAAAGPYDLDSVPSYPAHPFDLCSLIQLVTDNPAQVSADIRQALLEAQQLGIQPYVNPSNPRAMMEALFGPALAAWFFNQIGEFFFGGVQ